MRVIAGKLGGRQLVSFSADHLRPTTDRIKGSIFNKLSGEIEGIRVLDLFSGTGSLSIEAHSRGAKSVVAVESNPKSLKILRQNLAGLEILDGIEVLPLDVFKYLSRYEGEPFSIILVDPPFTQVLADKVLQALASSKAIGTGSKVIIEAGKREKVAQSYPPLERIDQRDYGDKSVSFFSCA